MAGTTNRDALATAAAPRPVGQGAMLLATMVMAAVILTSMGDSLRLQSVSAATEPTAPLSAVIGPSTAAARQPVDGRTDTTLVAAPGTFASVDDADLPYHQRRGRAALGLISYPWEQLLPGWSITFLEEQDGLYGLTLVPEKRIEIYVREGQSETLLAHVIAHELGHAVDVTLNDGGDRRRWEDSRGLDGEPWWPGSGATDFSTGAGDFAESFAAWQVGEQSFRSTLAGPPTAAQIELLADLATD